jgi:ferredoxin
VLVQEGQLRAEDVRVIAMDPTTAQLLPGHSVGDLLPWIREHYPAGDFSSDLLDCVREMDSLSLPERWGYWKEQFSRCIRCYACREACPLCYCERCIVDQGQPQWLEPSAHQRGNLNWNLIRAYHLAGRCTLCGACESACPVNIPLMTLNRMLARHVWEEFGYSAGLDPEASPLLSSWARDDSSELFR